MGRPKGNVIHLTWEKTRNLLLPRATAAAAAAGILLLNLLILTTQLTASQRQSIGINNVANQLGINLSEISRPSISSFLRDPPSFLSDDPDEASIERLTKTCLTVNASSSIPEQLNVTFHLYTKNNPHFPYILKPQITRYELIKSSPFDPKKPIKWITHGFHTNVDKSEWMLEAKNKILTFEDANVILTDWRRGASPALAFYPKAAANAHVVAMMIVKIFRRLRNDIDFSQVHLIGHSLGAHIMGFVGSTFTAEHLHQQHQQLLALGPSPVVREAINLSASPGQQPQPQQQQLIGRITACDPALPCFGPLSSSAQSSFLQSPVTAATTTTTSMPPSSFAAANDWASAVESGGGGGGGGGEVTENRRVDSSTGVGSATLDWVSPKMWTHLRPDSAVVVEVMHSNPGVMGYAEPLGDYDFYPNGFERQPGCGVHQADGSLAAHLDQKIRFTASPGGGGQSKVSAGSAIENIERARRQLGSLMGSVFASRRGQQQQQQQQVAAATETLPTTTTITTFVPQPNTGVGGEQQSSRLSQTIDKFIKPIRDFFQGYTCSHHRAVEYMVESMYYELVPQDRKLDRDFVCQMVGYRCSDYINFKRGFCFECTNENDCRALTMFGGSVSVNPVNADAVNEFGGSGSINGYQAQASGGRSFRVQDLPKFKVQTTTGGGAGAGDPVKASSSLLSSAHNYNSWWLRSHTKRMLPSLNNKKPPPRRNHYFFDTKTNKDFCLHHYHLFVKYRWFRVRENVGVDGFTLVGTLADITKKQQVVFNRFNHQSYTLLFTESKFLGQIEALLVFGDRIKPSLIDFIEVSYLSNLDPRIRALGSARLCRSQSPPISMHQYSTPNNEQEAEQSTPTSTSSNTETNNTANLVIGDNYSSPTSVTKTKTKFDPSNATLFVRCSGTLVR